MVDYAASLSILQKKIHHFPETLIVLGSGWNTVLEGKKIIADIPYFDLFGVTSTVAGHEGRLVIAELAGCEVACMVGRFHVYEGHSGFDATAPIRLCHKAGARKLMLTSASGALNTNYAVGDIIILSDLLTLFLGSATPLKGAQFVDMSCAFDEKMRKLAALVCTKNTIRFHEGVYSFMHGPQYETPSDKRALKMLGADVVGMSTVPETLMGRALGMRMLGLSIVTNLAFVKHVHSEVLAQAHKASTYMKVLLEGVVGGK